MRKEFILNLIIVVGANLLVKPFYIFGIDRTVQNMVGPEEYGVYFALFNFTLLFQIIADAGLQNFNNRAISQNSSLVSDYFPAILLLKTILALLFLGGLFIGAHMLDYAAFNMSLLLWLGVNTVLSSLILYLRSNISGLGKYKLDSVLSILDKVLMIIIIGFLLYTSTAFSIEKFVLGQTIALIISTLFILSISFYFIQPIEWPKSLSLPKSIIKQSWPYALVILMMTIYTRVDGVMLERLLPDGAFEAGVYAAGYRFFDASNMLGYLIAGLLLPMFSRLLGRDKNVFPLYQLSLRSVWLGSIFIAATCFIFRQELVNLLYIHADAYWGEVLGSLMISFIFIMVGYVTGSLLTAHGSVHQLNWIFLIGIIINVGLNLLLIPSYKAYGAAIATIFTQAFVAMAQLFFVNRNLFISEESYPVSSIVFGSLSIIIAVAAVQYFGSHLLHYIFGIGSIGCLLTAYFFFSFRKEIGNKTLDLSND